MNDQPHSDDTHVIQLDAAISDVTLYNDRARVTRHKEVRIPTGQSVGGRAGRDF